MFAAGDFTHTSTISKVISCSCLPQAGPLGSILGMLAGIPIIAMTANVFQEDVQAARNAGMDGHIAKPLDVEKMLSTLTQVLSKRHG